MAHIRLFVNALKFTIELPRLAVKVSLRKTLNPEWPPSGNEKLRPQKNAELLFYLCDFKVE